MITLSCPHCARQAEVPDNFYTADAQCHACHCAMQAVTAGGQVKRIGSAIRWRIVLLILFSACVTAFSAYLLAGGSL